eukprot:COSAG01_NODE_55866_length_322_cov_0.811659_1_plen_31_part_01
MAQSVRRIMTVPRGARAVASYGVGASCSGKA